MNNLFLNLAYVYTAVTLMVAEGNRVLEQLNIGAKPISATELKTYYVSPPRLRAGGSVETPDFFFGFGKDGRLQFITKNLPDAELSLPEKYEKWAKMKSLVDTNGAYALATNWLMKLDVDVAALEKEHPSQVRQLAYFPEPPGLGGMEKIPAVMLPRFDIRWGTNPASPAVWVAVFGPTKQPIHIRQESMAYSRRSGGLVKEREKLLAVSDPVFTGLSHSQKSNLVAQSTTVAYPHLSFPELAKAGAHSPATNTLVPTGPARKSAREVRPLRTVNPTANP